VLQSETRLLLAAGRSASEAAVTHTRFIAALIGAVACLAASMVPARAAIDAQHPGARYDATNDHIVFRVYSSRATRIELCLYAVSYGAPEAATYVLAREVDDVWSVTVSVAELQPAGITGPVFYGYRAWGPNWPYVSEWTVGSSAGFLGDVDASGNRFNPNKLLVDP
jgi:glycogen operon protein